MLEVYTDSRKAISALKAEGAKVTQQEADKYLITFDETETLPEPVQFESKQSDREPCKKCGHKVILGIRGLAKVYCKKCRKQIREERTQENEKTII